MSRPASQGPVIRRRPTGRLGFVELLGATESASKQDIASGHPAAWGASALLLRQNGLASRLECPQGEGEKADRKKCHLCLGGGRTEDAQDNRRH